MITHRPGHQTPPRHPSIPPLDDELAGLLDDLAGLHPGIDMMCDAIRLIALDRHTVDETQSLIAGLAGGADGTNVVTAIALAIARLSDADTNPALRSLPADRQKNAARTGQLAHLALSDPELHQTASETCAAIDGI
ncbi:hypothetical protein ACFV27_37165 [Streptomyces antimycoticus]|uniref:hypothetical protein n=1 Tax=Streptomyces antimycoticus TaxID=68175 RepID=UPI0036C22E73